MDLVERVGWFLVGVGIGFVLGYIVRSLRDLKDDMSKVKEEVDEVDGLVKRKLGDRKHDEEGFMHVRYVRDIAVLIVVCLTVWAAISTQKTNNELKEVQDYQGRLASCNQEYLAKTIRALNVRTSYTQEQAAANVELQRAQSEFLATVLRDPPASQAEREQAVRTYYDILQRFVKVNTDAKENLEDTPYPTNIELTECLNP